MLKPVRAPWPMAPPLVPPVLIHAEIAAVKNHPAYPFAKSGDADAAAELVADTLSAPLVEAVGRWASRAIVIPVHAAEAQGVNAIPLALAKALARQLGWPVWTEVVQINVVAHTGASGIARIARQALFDGEVLAGENYVLVDDFIGQGGTLANLRGHLARNGAAVVGATVLTGKVHSAQLSLTSSTLRALREKHGEGLEVWWRARFGHAFDCLTESEARYITRFAAADRVRAELAEAQREGDREPD